MNFLPSQKETSLLEADVNLTPLVDIVFLLLIFFMVTSTFAREQSLNVELPEVSSASGKTDGPSPLVISISETGATIIEGKEVPPAELMARLKDITQKNNDLPRTAVVVRADKKTPHGQVVKVLDACDRAGIRNVSLATVLEQ